VQANDGIIDSSETRDEVEKALLVGRDFRIGMRKIRGLNNAENERWQNRDSANAMSENFCKKARKLERKLVDPSGAGDATSDQKDAHWLAIMSAIWRIAIGVYTYKGDPFAEAVRLAQKIGEDDYFWRLIAPQFIANSSLRAPEEERSSFVARINSPGFNPNDAA
jgi:hypothetical protein